MAINKSGVKDMFDAIAPQYDFLNHMLTLGIDRTWRRKAIQTIETSQGACYLDVATGTGDLALAIAKQKQPRKIVGIDISDGMLTLFRQKIEQMHLQDLIQLKRENSEQLSFEDETFDVATIGFGIRNFQHPDKGLDEIYRVLKPQGEVIILEFSRPKNCFFHWVFNLYFCHILPRIGLFFSKHYFAYTYLPESVKEFPYGKTFTDIMESSGFSNVSYWELTFGIAMIYRGVKKNN